MRVRPISSSSDRKRFIQYPYDLYRDVEVWVPPLRMDQANTLNPKKNPFFEHGDMQLFLAENDAGDVVGRIAAIRNGEHLKKYDDNVGFFGFFEVEENEATAHALLDAAADWLRERGLTHVRGPANPTLNDIAGLLVDGFDREPSILMAYNLPYYQAFLTSWGFERAMTMWAYYVHKKYAKADKLKRGVELVKRRNPNLTVRTIDMKRFDQEIQTILDIYNEAWSDNWGHVPLTKAEAAHLVKEVKPVIDPRIIFLVEDDGVPVGFSLSLPNMNLALKQLRDGRLLPTGLPKLLARAKFGGLHEIRMPLMGVRKSYHRRGLDALLVLETVETGPRIGYDACEMSWVLDSNKVLLNALDAMGGIRDKEYALLERAL